MKAMLQLFKKYFIPHQQNDHRPHILRWEAILAILGLTLAVELFFLAQVFVFEPLTGIFSTILPAALTDLTNFNRQNDNLSALVVSPALERAAQLKAEDMAAKGYFAHTSPEGLTPWHWLEQAGYKFITAGENLAINFVDSQDVANAWMDSPGHRANILSNQFTEIGIAAARGIYKGQETIFVAQFFGRPTTAAIIKPEETAPAPPSISPLITVTPAPTNQSPAVASAEPQNQESFALVKGEIQASPTPSVVAAIPSEPAARKSALTGLQKILSEPRTMTNYLFLMLFTIISLALVLKVFIKIKIQHPPLIINGLLALLMISFAAWLNQFLSLYQARIF